MSMQQNLSRVDLPVVICGILASILPVFVLVVELPELIELIQKDHWELGLYEHIRANSIKWHLADIIGCSVGLSLICVAIFVRAFVRNRRSRVLAFTLIFVGEVLSIGTLYFAFIEFGLFKGG